MEQVETLVLLPMFFFFYRRARLSLSEKTALTAREGFRDIALRGGIMFDTANALRQLNSTYHISYNQLLEVFDASVAHSERYT